MRSATPSANCRAYKSVCEDRQILESAATAPVGPPFPVEVPDGSCGTDVSEVRLRQIGTSKIEEFRKGFGIRNGYADRARSCRCLCVTCARSMHSKLAEPS